MMGFPLKCILKYILQASVLFRRVFSRQFPNIDHIYGLLGARVPKIPFPSLPGYLRLRFRS